MDIYTRFVGQVINGQNYAIQFTASKKGKIHNTHTYITNLGRYQAIHSRNLLAPFFVFHSELLVAGESPLWSENYNISFTLISDR